MIELIKSATFSEVLGQDDVKHQLKSALLTSRHVILIGPPGIGKTTLARSLANVLPEVEAVKGCQYHSDPEKPLFPTSLGEEGKTETIAGHKQIRKSSGKS